MEPDSTGPPSRGSSDALVEVEFQPEDLRGFAAVVALKGEHDLASAAAVSDALEAIHGNVLVDLTDCEFIDSTVIGILIATQQERTREGQRLELVVPAENTPVARTIEVVGVGQLLTVHTARP